MLNITHMHVLSITAGSAVSTKKHAESKKMTLRLKPANNYMFKVNDNNARKRCEISLKLTIKIPERCE